MVRKIVTKANFFGILILGLLVFLTQSGRKYYIIQKEQEKQKSIGLLRERVASAVAQQLRTSKKLEGDVTPKVLVDYTIDEKLERYVKRLLRRYRSDYSSVVIIDNNSGDILTAIGYQRLDNQFDYFQPFSSTHPAASLFKIVTSASLLEREDVGPGTKFTFRGRGTTLYKYQLKDKKSRWNRQQSLANAFAYSNNVVFGKAAIEKVNSFALYKMANRFGFNEEILHEVSFSRSKFEMPEDQYQLAEMASGFNKKTLISPMHGAVMASIVAREGEYIRPSLLDTALFEGENIWASEKEVTRVITKETAKALKEMMFLTVNKGTARGSFRKFSRKLKKDLVVGGKTGSITGGIPFGKRDWFTAFAMPKHEGSKSDKGISICVMNVNIDKWYVRSSYLAKDIIEYYYKKISPIEERKKEVEFVKHKSERKIENV